MLSDFGAGTLLPMDQPELSSALQALEVRAFGYLLQELVAHANLPGAGPDRTLAAMEALTGACLHTRPADRPVMADVANMLADL